VAPAGIRIRASGRCWTGAAESAESRTVVDPTMFFGAALADTLRAGGIAVAGPVVRGCLVGPDGGPRREFTCDLVHASPLLATVTIANKRSQGFYAESLMKILGAFGPTPRSRAAVPRQGTWINGAEEVRRWLADRGIRAGGCLIDDGSGLSKENRLTAACVTQVLAVMYGLYGETFVETLSVAGDDGSLRKRMRSTAAEGRVFGKTGYVAGVSALSGYIRARSGRTIAFSILMNDIGGNLWKARLAQDKICVRLADGG
jgi:D-alanyl-D-alanine carboxypeptidase/D-alanyl-D-alanine-endopeptidase (penicillin-binding protein 4)